MLHGALGTGLRLQVREFLRWPQRLLTVDGAGEQVLEGAPIHSFSRELGDVDRGKPHVDEGFRFGLTGRR